MSRTLTHLATGVGSLAILLGALGPAAGGPVLAQVDGLDCPTPSDALMTDLEDIADEHGWTVEQAIQHECRTEVIGRIATTLSKAEPEAWIGSDVGAGPDDVARIYIKGPASERARELVADARVPIEIVDRQPYSFAELEDRVIEVQQALLGLGIEDFSISTDIAGAGLIPVHVRKTSSTPNRRTILRAIPADLRADVVLAIDAKGNWEPDTGTETPSPMTSPDPSASPTAGTDVAPTVAWGPMAMVRDPLRDQLDAGMEPGTIRINPFCVVIEGEAFATTLVFRDWQVIWRPSDETIVISDNSGELSVLADGDTVSLGGYSPWDEDATGEPAAPPWLVQPGPDCPIDLFLVHSARVAD